MKRQHVPTAEWVPDGSVLINQPFGAGPDPHEWATRISLKEDGAVVANTWVEGIYGGREKVAEAYELAPEKARHIRQILDSRKGEKLSPGIAKQLLAILK